MAGAAIASGIVSNFGGGFSNIISGAGDLLGIGSNRDSKRKKRSQYQKALRQAGVRADLVDNVHSDDWKELQKLLQFVQANGQLGVAYLNDTMNPAGFGGKKGETAAQALRGFQEWKRQRQPQNAKSTASTGMRGGGFRITNTMLLIAAGIAALFYFNRNRQ